MLVLSRKRGQKILIGDNISLVVLEVYPDGVKLGIDAPKSVPVYREELLAEMIQSNRQAASPRKLPELTQKPLQQPVVT
ncbi:MAG: carbon storage regulator [Vampirovibrionales bacterium]|nr:carbon storage regulator [Vampirovibrionales bacterium]